MSNYLPFGYRFIPTEEELLTVFLKNMAMGWLKLPHFGLIERDLYSDAPWKILEESDPWDIVVDPLGKPREGTRVIYVITKLANVDRSTNLNLAEDGKNKVRKAGCGTWHADTKKKDVYNSQGAIIGLKRSLSFVSNSGKFGRWTMHEYKLSGVSLEGLASNDYVLCRITKRDDPESSKGKSAVREFKGLGNNMKAKGIEQGNLCPNSKICKGVDSVEELQAGSTSASILAPWETENIIDTLELCEANNLLMNYDTRDDDVMMDSGNGNRNMVDAFEQCIISTGMVNGHPAMDERDKEENTTNLLDLSSSEHAPEWKQWLDLDTLEWPGLFDSHSIKDQFISDGVLFDNASIQDQVISDGVLCQDAVIPPASSKMEDQFKGASKEERCALAFSDGSASLEHAPADHGSLEAAKDWLDNDFEGDEESLLECMNFFDYDRYEKQFLSPWRKSV